VRIWIGLATSFFTILSMFLAGRKDWRAWAVGLGNQVLWLGLIVESENWGLLPLTVVLSVIYFKNLVAWRREAQA
jgi:hypothetical protein